MTKDISSETLNALLRELELPDTTKFSGYVIYLPDEEEFLHSIVEAQDKTVRKFCDSPEHAKTYNTKLSASKDAEKCKQRTDICYLLELDNQLMITPVDL